jgi:hypothetical protein
MSHLGRAYQLSPKELNQLAAVADVGGGHIRNAVLTAAMLAQAAERPIAFAEIIQGFRGKYRKLGRQLPMELTKSAGGRTASMNVVHRHNPRSIV